MFKKIKTALSQVTNFEQDLTKIYILALSSIAALILVFQSVKFVGQTQQLEQVSTLRLVDKQIYRAERIASMLLDTNITIKLKAKQNKLANVQRRLATVKENNQNMINSLKNFECQSRKCNSFLQSNFLGKNLDSLLRPINLSEDTLEKALKEIDVYQKFLIKVDSHIDAQIHTSANNLIRLDILFAILLIGVLLAQALWVFRPAVNKLNEALEARSDFISRISHEIRNPMNSIMGMAEILKSSNLKSDQRQNIEHLLRSSKVLLDMLNNLVDFSSTKNKTIELHATKSNLYKMLDKVVDVISIQAHDKGVEVFVDTPATISKQLFFDQIRLEQVLINLLNNALKFTEKGSITIEVREILTDSKSTSLRFSIKDTGIGISPEKQTVIFESFVQEDSSVKRRYGGSGLGLAICREILHLMGSQIYVESKKGKGSVFYFQLNLAKPEIITPYITQSSRPNIYYFCDHHSKASIESYLKTFAQKYRVFTSSDEIMNLEKTDMEFSEVIVDDSLGVVEMANVQTALLKKGILITPYALLRSNFSKENMALLRKKDYKQFLIKPFRAWHLQAKENDFLNWIEDKNSSSEFAQIEEDKRKNGLRVLAVDDSKDNLYLIKAILSSSADHVELAENGLEAVEKLKVSNFDLVFMDIQMPLMDGYTAIKKIRSMGKKLPVYAVTAHASLVEEKKCLEAGFNGRITKPINKKIILSKVQKLSKVKTKAKIEESDFESRMIRKLLPAYFDERLKDIAKMEKAIENNDLDSFQHIGHKIKGSAKSYGFPNIGEEGSKLEQAALSRKLKLCVELSLEISARIKEEKRNFETQA